MMKHSRVRDMMNHWSQCKNLEVSVTMASISQANKPTKFGEISAKSPIAAARSISQHRVKSVVEICDNYKKGIESALHLQKQIKAKKDNVVIYIPKKTDTQWKLFPIH